MIVNAIDVVGLSWQLERQSILSNISFSLPKGQMLGVIGANGAGKSSLLRCLYRYIEPTSGSISVLGQDIHGYSSRAFARDVAVVLQETPAHFEMTTSQLVAMGLTPHKSWFEFTNQDDKQHIQRALQQVGLEHKANQDYDKLSGGEKQRALIARAIVQRPSVLILDEPTNHLDVRYQIQILELVRSLGISVICSIHDLNLAAATCDNLLLLHQGHCVAYGSPQEVLTQTQIASAFGVSCEVQPHRQTGKPAIQYFYGYQPSSATIKNVPTPKSAAIAAGQRRSHGDA
ncbi:ABC transporter ATP-binding protein [Shewanella gelidii]|uniref:ABC cobalamin uptake system ATPase BtuD n=1 Tax=Shewanella gelidii TaxID=1642821 RepID=A0A917N8U8_9GAMM|nr:ABC transporter ATP-binding protein [Shewanella gelidii]MCL1097905.1 ABC transporter ATP-binding protein [Shewanella gelidii]GGI77828.1 ABC cobalamin uptake system ATPase BtuD [Shewanella gelidii]